MNSAIQCFVSLRKKTLSLASHLDWLAPLLARVTLGFVFVHSGWGKLHNLEKVTEFFRELGIPAPHLQAPFVAATELSCGLLVLVGLATRLASIPLSVTMVVALLTAKKDELTGLNELFGQSEYLYLVLFAWLILTGPGRASFDQLLARRFT